MKNACLYSILFIYGVSAFKPLFPSIADTVAHVFWYSRHVATVHAENGRYHVHLEYARAAKNTVPEKQAVPEAGVLCYVPLARFPEVASLSLTQLSVSFGDYLVCIPTAHRSPGWLPPRA